MAKQAEGWRVLIVDGDDLRRRDLATDTEKVPEVADIVVAASVEEALEALPAEAPDVLIVDLDVAPPPEVAQLGKAARSAGANVLLVMAGQDPSILAAAMEWASGFLPRTPTITVIGYAIQVASTGSFYMESDHARGMVEELDALREVTDRALGSESLTPREKEVLRLLSEGLSARQMARQLKLSERTVNTHVANVYRKLAVSNRVQAVRQAIRLGLVNESS
ncbi:MAG TPA: response regulator transcription factor [Actinomycetota bacterium]|nr:response regulator transcription factor [Actinomycetota bacterium]